MKIALVHDYLSQDGGAERVLKTISEIWPEAPIFVLFHDKKKIPYIDRKQVKESFLAKMPLVKKVFPYYLPLMPRATEGYDLKDFDVVLSSTSAFAKGIKTSPETLHISYCHTPPRYLWNFGENYLDGLKKNYIIKKIILPRIVRRLKIWDKKSSERVNYFLVNSETVKERVKKYYDRESTVIYPAIDFNNFRLNRETGEYYTAGGRLVSYKKIDLIVRAFNRLGYPLKIFGTGAELAYLKKIAKPNIEFLGKISDQQKADLFAHTKAFIHPQLEDFGLTPLEAMASGRPVIAYQAGGATETVLENETGMFFKEQTWESLYEAICDFEKTTWDPHSIRQRSLGFHSKNFKKQIKKFVEDKWSLFKQQH